MQFEFEIIYELSERYPIQKLCSIMDINRSSFYKWEKRLYVLNEKKIKRMENIQLFMNYQNKYPTHGYSWLNAKIRLDLGLIMSDNYAQRCCSFAGIKSVSKRCKFRKPGNKFKIYPNLLMLDLDDNKPFQVVVSDMTAFWVNDTYY